MDRGGILYKLLDTFVTANALGIVLFAPLPVHLWKGTYREPDILYMRAENRNRIQDYWQGAGTQATSVLLPGFTVAVDQVMALAASERA